MRTLVAQAHADNLHMQAMMVTSEPAKAEVATKAESLKAQAQSLEARAEAQNLQVRLSWQGCIPLGLMLGMSRRYLVMPILQHLKLRALIRASCELKRSCCPLDWRISNRSLNSPCGIASGRRAFIRASSSVNAVDNWRLIS